MKDGFIEIERKFLIDRFPSGLPLKGACQVYQAYLSLEPEVRVRRYVKDGQDGACLLTVKSGGGLVRREVELEISNAHFAALSEMAEHPPVSKDFRVYELPDGLELECSLVDKGQPSEFMYAEIEFPSEDSARRFSPLPFFKREVTGDPSYRMKNYWKKTRCRENGTGETGE